MLDSINEKMEQHEQVMKAEQHLSENLSFLWLSFSSYPYYTEASTEHCFNTTQQKTTIHYLSVSDNEP